MPYYTTYFGNASSFHQFGREAKEGLDKGRAQVASLINADPREVYFTNGGSESDNWALEGTAFARRNKGNHIITSKIEHHAVLHTCEYLEKVHGFEVTYLDVDADGKVDLEQLKNVITDKTILVSVMYANNEIGTIQPIKEITEIAHAHGALTVSYTHLDVYKRQELYFPLYLWWKITNIIPLRLVEFCIIPYDCIKESADGKNYIYLRRSCLLYTSM